MNSIALSLLLGILTSAAWAVLVLAHWQGVDAGLSILWQRAFPKKERPSSVGFWMGWVGASAFALKAVPLLFWAFIALCVMWTFWGLPRAVRLLRAHPQHVLVFGLATLLWSIWLRDVDGLTQAGDGVVHTLFMERIWELKRFPLFDHPLPFSDFFRTSLFQFYPQLTHLVAVAIGLPLRALSWGIAVLTPAQVAKGSMIALCAGFITLAFDYARRFLGPKHLVLVGITTLFAANYFRFPIATVDQGGWSRMVGMFCVIAWSSAWSARSSATRTARSGSLGFGPVALAAYLMHPQAAALACLYWAADQQLHWRSVLSGIFSAVCLGVAVIGFVPTQGFTISVDELRGATTTQWHLVPEVIRGLFVSGIGGESYAHLLLRKVALVVGCVALLLPTAPALWRKRVALWLLAGAGLSACAVLAHPLARIAGAPFYHESGRIAELFWPLLPVIWAQGLLTLSRGFQRLTKRGHSAHRILFAVCALFLASELGWKWPHSLIALQGHLDFYNNKYRSPRISKTGALIAELDAKAAQAPRPLLLIAPHFVADSFPFRMRIRGARSYFVYGECPIGGSQPLGAPGCWDRNEAWRTGHIPAALLAQYTPVFLTENGIAQSPPSP